MKRPKSSLRVKHSPLSFPPKSVSSPNVLSMSFPKSFIGNPQALGPRLKHSGRDPSCGFPPKACGNDSCSHGDDKSLHTRRGFVSLVGAGPGDPKLLTLRGKESLENADIVIYDYLVHPAILKHAPQAQLIYVGKKGGDPNSASQKSIESLLLDLARKGKRIVRLKGGDPFVFGRGGEEALFLAEHGIPFEIVPGITAGIAAPAYSGIPVTHRGMAAEVTFITGHEDPAKDQQDINWKAVAELSGTVVLFMGVKTLPEISSLLIRYGKPASTPVSVIRWGSTAEQQVVSGTLGSISEEVEKAKLIPPALTVIGEVNRLRSKLKWFEKKPLFGKTVLITRSRKQASQLGEQLEFLGAHVLELPTIEISPIENNFKLDRAIKKIRNYDWFVFTSENGVEAFFERLKNLKQDSRILNPVKIAAIGPGTKAKLNSYLIKPDLIPKTFTTEGLIQALEKVKPSKKRFLLLRTNIAPDLLSRSLKKLGGDVTEIAIYKTEKPKNLAQKTREIMHNHSIDYITFTSSSTAENFFNSLRNGRHLGAKIISIGPVTSKTIQKCGFKVSREAKESTIPGLVQAILEENKSLSSPLVGEDKGGGKLKKSTPILAFPHSAKILADPSSGGKGGRNKEGRKS